ncbi:hypothetical protein F3I62_18975 [Pseudomonas sp. R-28-1W-6]|uniref:DUF4116 domain-containing protein n=1 Tax=Pseudomonas sp. R-28-1W-6 TaxID=2650101 RepID=UPI001365D973|nr:DUF4116 domain-containing protein [Pseudomonas sp. R-28-1W-6]MWV14189.1 hypothetical protein [Pseudomonas sp. R-28-1W-6]
MIEIEQGRYRQIALACLSEHGISPAVLALEASPGLKRFRLDVDMGELDIDVPEGAPVEDPLLPYATSLLTHLIAWPPKVEAYGVNIAGLIEEAICWRVGLNEGVAHKPDWSARIHRDTGDHEERDILSSRFTALRVIEQLLRELPVEHYSFRVCETALMTVLDSLQHMPVEVRTREVCLRAVELHAANVLHVPHELMDREMLERIVEIQPFSITSIPDRLIYPELAQKAVAGHPSVVVFIPDKFLTPKLIEMKFEEKERALKRRGKADCIDN